MKWVRYLVLAVCVGSLGCSSDGGSVGTGVSDGGPVGTGISAISGNVVDVQTSTATSSSPTPVALPQIDVSIDDYSNLTTKTDSNGNFMLSGNFAGTITLRFTAPQFQVTQQLDVPSGSTIVLQDIELQPGSVVAQAARQLDFFGTVNFVDCSAGLLHIHEWRPGGMQFLVQLDDQTSYVEKLVASPDCTDIQVGTKVTVEGTIDYATDPQTITALVVSISPQPPPPPQAQFDVRFTGAVAALDCSAGLVVVDDSVQRTRVQLTSQTMIIGASGQRTCQDLQLGDHVQGQGQIALPMLGMVEATQLDVTGPPTSGQPLRFVGFVTTVSCDNGALQLRFGMTTIDVQIEPTTVIERPNGQRLTCADIQPGDHVTGLGLVAPDASGTLDATQITVNHHGMMGTPVGP
jgi:hypothetical protein